MISRRCKDNQDFCTVEGFFFDDNKIKTQRKEFDGLVFRHKNFTFIVNEIQKFNIDLESRFKEIDCVIQEIESTLNDNSGNTIYVYSGVCNNPSRVEESIEDSSYITIDSLKMDCCGATIREGGVFNEDWEPFDFVISPTEHDNQQLLKHGAKHVIGNLYVFVNEREYEGEEDDY